MKCPKCKVDFEEEEIEESHDVPCYLFEGNRKGSKNQADKFPRHNLCTKCHKKYEKDLKEYLRKSALFFATHFFKKEDDTNTT